MQNKQIQILWDKVSLKNLKGWLLMYFQIDPILFCVRTYNNLDYRGKVKIFEV